MNNKRRVQTRNLQKNGIAKAQGWLRSSRWIAAAAVFTILVVLVALTAITAIYVPEIVTFVPIMALALALALQKYVASFFAFFVITFSRIYDLGDRIRIGNIKGDVRRVGMLHTTLEEVGEDEKLGGELTGRLLQVPNLIILDQAVLNYSKDYSVQYETIASDYMFDEVRIPLTTDSNLEKAIEILEEILKQQDAFYINEARQMFQNGYPRFLDEASSGTRVLVFIEPQYIWIKGKFVAPLKGRNDLKSNILEQFINEVSSDSDIKLA